MDGGVDFVAVLDGFAGGVVVGPVGDGLAVVVFGVDDGAVDVVGVDETLDDVVGLFVVASLGAVDLTSGSCSSSWLPSSSPRRIASRVTGDREAVNNVGDGARKPPPDRAMPSWARAAASLPFLAADRAALAMMAPPPMPRTTAAARAAAQTLTFVRSTTSS